MSPTTGYSSARQSPYLLESIDTANYMLRSGFAFIDGDAVRVGPILNEGKGVVVSEVFSNQTGLRVGQRFKAVVESVELDLPIVGIIRDYRTQGGVVYCALSYFERETGDRQWTGANIFLKDRSGDLNQRISGLRNGLPSERGRPGRKHRSLCRVGVAPQHPQDI